MEQCGACHNFFCPTCEGTTQCRDCDIFCCTGCKAASCPSCEEIICATCNNQEGPSFSTTCDSCNKSICRLCAPTCPEKGCSKNICRDCQNEKQKGCDDCGKHYCSDHKRTCSVGGCTSKFCLSCLKDAAEDDKKDNLGYYCTYCCHLCPSKTFVCTCCSEECKLGFCSECEDEFVCPYEKCSIGGRNQRYCNVCDVSYCSECSPSHKEHCKSPNDPNAEVVWFDHMNDLLNRRMGRFYRGKAPSTIGNPYRYQANSNPYMPNGVANASKRECSSEDFFNLPLQEKIAFAEKVYAEVRKRHKSEEILDIGSARVQPRIDSKFKKKPKKKTGQH